MSQEPTITMKELDSYIIEAINQLRSSKKQPNENTIFNLLLEKLEAIAINKERLKRLSKNNSMLLKKALPKFQTIRNNKTRKKLWNFFKNKINF